MALDLNSLQKAVGSLEKAINVASSVIKGNTDTDHEKVIRAGVIQNFKSTYERSWKFMKRWLEGNLGGTYVDGVSRKELFRIAAENRLIDDVEAWFAYHEARNQTAHIYDEHKAEAVFETAQNFLPDAKEFLKNLENKNN